ncbi:hypothetical protein B9J09_03045 [Xylella fastidiosa subsp. pauca]|uniref:hypothetical protein n=1 Tax=Xylella fastidiosa TaxID=2371 RepID=UPI0005836EE8|nr:hypothetical protein [Xylella fastidiosa]ARO68162.1 hypothetical protein B9J09_03045 [Xylella fastidiosa subsp. pauca]AVI22322.1 hypothetical protein BC375_02860 [Xylella fastidiosa]KIA57607.1 hypothetical protein RA12_10510 [Xylella fastidiosa]KXB11105.1 hypothetical protein ADT33_10355 [Xylella fastidiosa]KXB12526.1 hypothetical protein ADT32_03655 [Xylella fastidiosa]
MNIPRVLKRLLKLCGLLALALLMVCGAILSCGKNNMTEKTPQQAAAKGIKEVSKVLMIKTDDSSHKKCFKFPYEISATNTHINEVMFRFKNIGYFSGIDKSPGKFGEPRMSMVTAAFFHDKSVKEHYISSLSQAYRNGDIKISWEYKELYFYNLRDLLYSAIDKDGLFIIEYDIGDDQPRNKREWIHELQLIIDFVNTHTIPCQGES